VVKELPTYDVAPQAYTVIKGVYPAGGNRGVVFVWTDDGVRQYAVDPTVESPPMVVVRRSACR
jgi:hypothetical protein